MKNSNRVTHSKLLTASTRVTYDGIGKVYCPILKEDVYFTARGFHHLNYEAGGTPRTINERIYKLTLFPLAVPTIKNATVIEEERDVLVRVSRKKGTTLKKGKAFALVAKVGRKNPIDVRVIVMRVGNGKLAFRSIMKH